MKFFSKIKKNLPSFKSSLLAIASAVLLILAFPDFEFWILAWFALIPLFVAVENEKESFIKSFLTGWLFGTVFFFGTCWWLTFAPITYAGFPVILTYILMLCAASVVGLYTALFGGVFSIFLKRFGHWGILSAPFLWTAIEFLRLYTSGNNWNAVGYSQAFNSFVEYASFGGVFFVGFCVVFFNAFNCWLGESIYKILKIEDLTEEELENKKVTSRQQLIIVFTHIFQIILIGLPISMASRSLPTVELPKATSSNYVVAVQPNVPMMGLTPEIWQNLRQRQIDQAETALQKIEEQSPTTGDRKVTVVLPESPMNYNYELDPEFRQYINGFAGRNNVSVLFNSAEPDRRRENGYFNSAVLINEKGEKVVQYDKIHLLPFGEFVPLPEPIEWLIPPMVGRFSPGVEYDLLPFGEAKAGVMICFESHFPSLSREYVRRGADVLVEMTNDGYLGNTPVLRQHLASGVFRAVETNRPVLRVTNVGITAYINERGEVLDTADVYTEAVRIWPVSKSDGKQTVYVKYGEWFAWLCSIVSFGLLIFSFRKRKK